VRRSTCVFETALLLATLTLVGCANHRTVEPVPGVPFTDVLAVGRELGMAAQRDPVSQGIILSDAVNRVVICPGTAVAMVNREYVDLGRPARYHEGRLVVPVAGLKRITARLKPRPIERRRGE
jgi:hypothetical protein